MQTNQIFNFSRFGRYTKSSLILYYRQLLISWGGTASAIFLWHLLIAASYNKAIRGETITQPFLIFFFGAGIVYVGNSFPAFRKKEKTIASLTIPISAMERFVYEFLEKIAAFIVFYPPIFYIASNSAIFIRNRISLGKTEIVEYTVNGVTSKVQLFPHKYFSLTSAVHEFKDGQLLIFLSVAFVIFSIAFAGAASFRKYPLGKTIVFCGALIASVAGYLYFIIQKLRLQNPWIEPIGDTWKKESVIAFACSILILCSLVALTYSYFKVKEKEVQ